MIPASGIRFGRFRLLDELGRGGMAVVFRAVVDGPKGFSRSMVLKRILRDCAQDPAFVNMLASEARLSALLRHPNIVQVHEFGEVDGEFYLAMELVEGSDLLGVLRACARKKLRLPPGVVCHLVAELASALAYAHALTDELGRRFEIVHRDVSPANIMVTSIGMVKLLDFGIAKAAGHVRQEQTRTGMLKGKLSYLSPEQSDGRLLDRRSDVFSLGIVFWECLVAKRLFRRKSELETLRLIRQAQVPPPSQLVPGLDPAIDAIVRKMLARDPSDRYATCDEVVEALRPIARRYEGDAAALARFLDELGDIPRRTRELTPAEEDELYPATTTEAQLTPPANVQLAPPASVQLTPPANVQLAPPAALAGATLIQVPNPASPTGPQLPITRPLPQVGRRRPRRWPWLAGLGAGAVGALAAGVAAVATTRAPEAPANPQASIAAGLPVAAVAAVPSSPQPAHPIGAVERVRLRVDGTPGAEVLLDGALVGTVPVDLTLPRATQRALTVRRAGYRPFAQLVAGDVDVTLIAPLRKLKGVSQPKPVNPNSHRGFIKDPFHT